MQQTTLFATWMHSLYTNGIGWRVNKAEWMHPKECSSFCNVWTGNSKSGAYIFKVALSSDNSAQNKGQQNNAKWGRSAGQPRRAVLHWLYGFQLSVVLLFCLSRFLSVCVFCPLFPGRSRFPPISVVINLRLNMTHDLATFVGKLDDSCFTLVLLPFLLPNEAVGLGWQL